MYIIEISETAKPILIFLGKILNFIHIGVPIALILFISIDLAKAVLSSDDDQIAKVTRSIKNRVIACLAIFFLPTIIEVIFSKVFISLNMNEEQYKEILAGYKSVINSEQINTQDESKNTEISGKLKYSMGENQKSEDNKESDFIEISKTITPYIFSSNKFNSIISSVSSKDFNISYQGVTYNLESKFNIKYNELISNEATYNGEYIIVNVSLKDATINSGKKYEEVLVDYYYKKNKEKYELEKVNVKPKEEVSNYIESISKDENSDGVVSTKKYASIDPSYDYSSLNSLSKKDLDSIYKANLKNVVIFNTMTGSTITNNATGFFISNGVVATSWSYLQASFMNSSTIAINDINNNFYTCDGVVAIDVSNDIAVLKLNKEVARHVSFGNGNLLKKNDPILSIISKTGFGFTTITGIVSSSGDDIISVLPLSKNDWGSPLIDKNGKVVGINTSRLVNSELSRATNIDGLKKLQSKLMNTKFSDIKFTSIKELKKQYYYKDNNKETVKSSIPEKIWSKYKKIGNIEENIVLDLIKASYYDGILSLRYNNETTIDNMAYHEAFASQLLKDGYKKEASANDMIIYRKGKTKVVIMSEFNYLIIVIAR